MIEEFTKGQMAIIEGVAHKVGDVVVERMRVQMETHISTVLALHMAQCENTVLIREDQAQRRGLWKALVLVSTIVSGIVTFLTVRIFNRLFPK